MADLFAGWRPGQIIGLVAVAGGLLTVMVMCISIVWYLSRRDSLLANQKHDYLERGFTIEQIDRLLRAPGPSAGDAAIAQEKAVEANLASLLVQYEVPSTTMQRVLQLFKETEPASKKAICDAIEEMLEAEVGEEQLIAAVTSLCSPRDAAQPRTVGIA
jgi:hypothetical protein